MIDLKTQYVGLTLRNPIIVGSSGLTKSQPITRNLKGQVPEQSY